MSGAWPSMAEFHECIIQCDLIFVTKQTSCQFCQWRVENHTSSRCRQPCKPGLQCRSRNVRKKLYMLWCTVSCSQPGSLPASRSSMGRVHVSTVCSCRHTHATEARFLSLQCHRWHNIAHRMAHHVMMQCARKHG
jgi:hypothetical protein